MKWFNFEDRDELAASLAEDLAVEVRAAAEADRRFGLAVSGGSTPRRLFAELSTRPAPWDRADTVLVDERWTGRAEDRNETLVRSELLRAEASGARFWNLWAEFGELPPEEAAVEIERCAREVGRFPPARPLDVVVLGMGLDAHTASLFPEAPQLVQGLTSSRSWIAVDPVTAPHPRISMTRSAIASSRRVLLHIEGAQKREVLEAAMESTRAPYLPVRSVADAVEDLEVWWAP